MFYLNLLWIRCPINKTIDSGLGIKCLVYKMVSLMSYVIYHTKSDIKGFVCIFVIVDRLTKRLRGLFMIVLLSFYVLFYSFNCHILELFWLIGFFVVSFYINNTMFCKTNSSGTTLDTRIKYFMQPCWWISFFSIWCTTGIEIISNIQWLFETQSWGWVMSWSRPFVSNIRCQRSLLKTDSCDWALSRSGVSNLWYLQLIFETCSRDRDAFGASVSNLRFQRSYF